jgi:hypothetical protein
MESEKLKEAIMSANEMKLSGRSSKKTKEEAK